MKNCLLMLAVIVIAGCATGTHIITGNQRSPIPSEQVVLYPTPPKKYEIIGIVNAETSGRRQWQMDLVVAEIKKQAAAIGANGVILGGGQIQSGGQGFAAIGSNGAMFVGGLDERIQLSGQAVWVTNP